MRCVLAYTPFLLPFFFKASCVSAPVISDAKQITPTSSSLKQPHYSLSQLLWVRNGGRAPWGGSGLGPFTQVQLAMPLPQGDITASYLSHYIWASLVAQTVKNLPTMWETWVRSLGWEDPLGEEMATHSSTLAWRIPWTEEPGGL